MNENIFKNFMIEQNNLKCYMFFNYLTRNTSIIRNKKSLMMK